MKVLEWKIEGKSEQVLCEDCLAVTRSFAAVIDGVTSKSDFAWEGKSTGRLAAELVARAVKNAPAEAGLEELIGSFCREFKGFYETVDFPYDKRELGLQAAAAVYSDEKREIWLIGDCQAMVDGIVYQNPKKSDEILAAFRSLVMELTGDPIQARALIVPWIVRACKFANRSGTSYGYAVIGGEEIPLGLIRRIALDGGAHQVVLASDGYPVLRETLEESEKELERILREDPECCRQFCSTKGLKEGNTSFDDRTYIRLSVDKKEGGR